MLLETSWTILLQARPDYVANVINSADAAPEDVDSDGHIVSIDNLNSSIFDLVAELCIEKSVKKMFGLAKRSLINDQPSDQLVNLCKTFIYYIQLGQRQVCFNEIFIPSRLSNGPTISPN